MKYNEKSAQIKALQDKLIALGYALPLYGADGHMGEETWDALAAFSRANGIEWEPAVPPTTIDVLSRAKPNAVGLVIPSSEGVDISKVLDLTSVQTNPPHIAKNVRIGRDGKAVVRPASDITTIMIHQTGIEFSVAPYQVKAAGGDKKLAKHKRALDVAAHMTTFNDGQAVLANPLLWYVNHGNKANLKSCGLEIEGLFTGKYDPAKPQLTEVHLEGCKQALKYMVTKLREAGAPVEFIIAHRQVSDSRRADPGAEIWLKLVIQYAIPVLGLKPQLGFSIDGGKPIPKEWDPSGVGSY